MPHLLMNIGVDKMSETEQIENLKARWREAMKDLESAKKNVDHWAYRIQEARKKEYGI